MDFLAGAGHIFLAYLAMALFFCATPYFKWWERLVEFLNRLEINGKRLAAFISWVFPAVLFIALIIIHLYQYYKELGLGFWTAFAPSAFIVVPFLTAYFGIAPIARSQPRLPFGYLAILLFSYGGFAGAGVNSHDVLWCGEATQLYTQTRLAGEDLYPWVKLFHAPSFDYRLFGSFMLIQAAICLVMSHVTYFRFLDLTRLERNLSPLKWNWVAVVCLAFATTMIDWPELLPPLLHTAVIAAAIIASSLAFRRSGKILAGMMARK